MPNSCAVNDTLISAYEMWLWTTCALAYCCSCMRSVIRLVQTKTEVSILHLMHAQFTVLVRPCEHTFKCGGASTSS
jgi:hypothetical protein